MAKCKSICDDRSTCLFPDVALAARQIAEKSGELRRENRRLKTEVAALQRELDAERTARANKEDAEIIDVEFVDVDIPVNWEGANW